MGGNWNLDLGCLVEKTGLGVLCLRDDRALTIVKASDSFYRSLGYRRGEISALLAPGRPPVLRGETPLERAAVLDEIRRRGWARPEMRLIRRDGRHVWMAYRVCLMPDDRGRGLLCGMTEDITLRRRERRLRQAQAEELAALTDNIPAGVLRYKEDETLTLSVASDGFCHFTGYARKEIAERFCGCFLPIVCPEDRMKVLGRFVGKDPGDVSELTYRLAGRDGRVIWVLDKARRQADGAGGRWIYSVLMDVTKTRRAQEQLAASEERCRRILENVAVAVVDYDFRTKEVYFSPAFVEKFGDYNIRRGDLQEMIKNTAFFFPAVRGRALDWLSALCREKKASGTGDCRLRAAGGSYIWCNVKASLFYDRQGRPTRLTAIFSDIDRRKKETFALREQAEHDLLTGLYNRVTTMRRIDGIIAQSGPGDRHTLFVIDIDNFKQINDCMGHLCGDRMIVRTAEEIRRLFRSDDVAGRIGGDEFVVFVRNADSALTVRKAEALRLAFERMRDSVSFGRVVSGSIGIALYPLDGRSYEALFRKADIALYAAKHCGKDAFRVYMRGIESLARLGGGG